jgi:hypothetical protein
VQKNIYNQETARETSSNRTEVESGNVHPGAQGSIPRKVTLFASEDRITLPSVAPSCWSTDINNACTLPMGDSVHLSEENLGGDPMAVCPNACASQFIDARSGSSRTSIAFLPSQRSESPIDIQRTHEELYLRVQQVTGKLLTWSNGICQVVGDWIEESARYPLPTRQTFCPRQAKARMTWVR